MASPPRKEGIIGTNRDESSCAIKQKVQFLTSKKLNLHYNITWPAFWNLCYSCNVNYLCHWSLLIFHFVFVFVSYTCTVRLPLTHLTSPSPQKGIIIGKILNNWVLFGFQSKWGKFLVKCTYKSDQTGGYYGTTNRPRPLSLPEKKK